MRESIYTSKVIFIINLNVTFGESEKYIQEKLSIFSRWVFLSTLRLNT